MAFLDNSGNIILDATLSDLGRMRLANGTFRISKFALGDDEINYNNYNKSHASGSAYYDLAILQTPILEAFTNNTSTMNSKLISIARTNLLYLPILKLYDITGTGFEPNSIGSHIVAVDKETEDSFTGITGIIKGENLGGSKIRIDQGLDTTEIASTFTIDNDLLETQYIIEIDNRFAKIVGENKTVARLSYIDDDSIASYYLSLGTDAEFVVEHPAAGNSQTTGEVIAGPRGTILKFQLQSSIELNTSTYLFELLGSTTTMNDANGNAVSIRYIDSYIRINGATTGFRLDVPVRYIKDV